MIAGGLDRGNEFDELVPDITGLKKMVILGQSAERVKRAADKAGVAYVEATDIADATRKAYELATQGDVVLLSPANASWDMYANFEVRGDLFIDTVAELKRIKYEKIVFTGGGRLDTLPSIFVNAQVHRRWLGSPLYRGQAWYRTPRNP